MKNICFTILVLSLLTGGISSCKKSSTRKISNQWTVTSSEEQSADTYADGSNLASFFNVNGNAVNRFVSSQDANGVNQTSSSSGIINLYEYIINKDGTWSSTKNYTIIISSVKNITYISELSGTWNFVKKNSSDDFKKNEKVLFNVLSDKHTAIQIEGPETYQTESKHTFLPGENVLIYKVLESKTKKLKFQYEKGATYNQSTATDHSQFFTSSGNLTLEQK